MRITGNSRCVGCGEAVVVRDLTDHENVLDAKLEHIYGCKELDRALDEASYEPKPESHNNGPFCDNH